MSTPVLLPETEWAELLADLLRDVAAPLTARLDALERDVQRLIQARYLRDAGTWQPDVVYEPGQCVTSAGQYWVCREATRPGIRPGSHHAWRLLFKTT